MEALKPVKDESHGSTTEVQTEHSIRRIAVPEFAAAVIRARLDGIPSDDPEREVGRVTGAWAGASPEIEDDCMGDAARVVRHRRMARIGIGEGLDVDVETEVDVAGGVTSTHAPVVAVDLVHDG